MKFYLFVLTNCHSSTAYFLSLHATTNAFNESGPFLMKTYIFYLWRFKKENLGLVTKSKKLFKVFLPEKHSISLTQPHM